MWSLFLYYESEASAKNELYKMYLTHQTEQDAQRLAYENVSKFIYFIKQGKSYLSSAAKSDLIVRPLLLFYGCTSLLKAILLLRDPLYPKTTAVLQHGMTTRKRKKRDYLFYDDEIKIQREGLLPHFSSTVLLHPLTIHQKYKVSQLLCLIPELHDSYQLLYKEEKMKYIAKEKMTNDKSKSFISDYKGNHYTFLQDPPDLYQHQIMVHYMLMYILGMLCRYDTELWGDLIFSFQSHELYIIDEFLHISLRLFPNLILNQLFQENIYFLAYKDQ